MIDIQELEELTEKYIESRSDEPTTNWDYLLQRSLTSKELARLEMQDFINFVKGKQ